MTGSVSKIDRTVSEVVPKSIRVATIVECRKGSGVVSIPYFGDGCPVGLGAARHVDTLCPYCTESWEASGYRIGKVSDFSYSLRLLDKVKERNW
jgi:hypothetical protein